MTSRSQIRVILGRCDDMRAEIFVRLEDGGEPAELSGVVEGPRRGRDATLPTTARLLPLPAAASRTTVSRAILTEPAFWSPELPNLYRIEALRRPTAGGQSAITAWIGLRRLGVRGRSFWLDGRRWVPRAVGAGTGPSEAREASVGLILEQPSDEFLTTTDATGVAVVAVLRGAQASADHIARLASHPSAMLVILVDGPRDEEPIALLRRAAGTMQLGLSVDGTAPPPAPADGIDYIVVSLPENGVPHDGWRSPPPRPLVAWRASRSARRRDCDLAQRDLARWGVAGAAGEPVWDWAGYFVGGECCPGRLSS